MLNRTNRTLSATTNRLDLGTRTFGLLAGGNLGNLTLRNARNFSVSVVRAVVSKHSKIQVEAPPIMASKPTKCSMLSMPGSSLLVTQPSQGRWSRGQGQTARSQAASSYGLSRPSLDWRSGGNGLAARAARADLALDTGAAPIS
jgi:hypothetical protein